MRSDPLQKFMEESTLSSLRGEDIAAKRKAQQEAVKAEDIKRIQEEAKRKADTAKQQKTAAESKLANKTLPNNINITHALNIKMKGSDFIFDAKNIDGSIVRDIKLSKDAWLELHKIINAKQTIIKKEKRKKLMEFAIIYPGAVISLVYLIHTLMTYLPLIKSFFSADFGAFK